MAGNKNFTLLHESDPLSCFGYIRPSSDLTRLAPAWATSKKRRRFYLNEATVCRIWFMPATVSWHLLVPSCVLCGCTLYDPSCTQGNCRDAQVRLIGPTYMYMY
jgi:hypothetical protein